MGLVTSEKLFPHRSILTSCPYSRHSEPLALLRAVPRSKTNLRGAFARSAFTWSACFSGSRWRNGSERWCNRTTFKDQNKSVPSFQTGAPPLFTTWVYSNYSAHGWRKHSSWDAPLGPLLHIHWRSTSEIVVRYSENRTRGYLMLPIFTYLQ